MIQRPKSITIIGWYMIVASGISLITMIVMLNNPTVQELMAKNALPIPLQFVIILISLIIHIVCGIGMLKRLAWARMTYVVFTGVSFCISLLTSPMKMALIPSIVFFGVIVFFLFRPKANDYFAHVQS